MQFSSKQWVGGKGVLTAVGINVAARWCPNCLLRGRRHRLGVHGKGGAGNRSGGGAGADTATLVAGGLTLKGFADVAVVISDPWRRWLVSEWARDGGGLTMGGRRVPASLNGVNMRGRCAEVYGLLTSSHGRGRVQGEVVNLHMVVVRVSGGKKGWGNKFKLERSTMSTRSRGVGVSTNLEQIF